MYKTKSFHKAKKSYRQFRGSPKFKKNVERIDPKLFVKAALISETTKYNPKNTINDFDLESLLHKNLLYKGYSVLSQIQDEAIPMGLAGKDIIGIASTGTGKTAAFAIPLLQKILTDKSAYALIIAPTRELAQQIESECKSIAKGSGIYGTLLIGGSGMNKQVSDLKSLPRIVIGTPGRIKDHLSRGNLKLANFNIVVLDEVDRMLDMGFIGDVTEILKNTNNSRQSFFFSATIDNRVKNLINNFCNDPYTISIKASSASENVHQDVIRYQDRQDKIEKLHDVLNKEGVDKVLVFNETQRDVDRLNKDLRARGFNVASIHGGRTQGQRQRALNKFKQNEINILVATDVAARGIDVSDITHVVNYSIPKAYIDYVHRIGRAGRAGKVGYALTFITQA